jgi:hypothetical protein
MKIGRFQLEVTYAFLTLKFKVNVKILKWAPLPVLKYIVQPNCGQNLVLASSR